MRKACVLSHGAGVAEGVENRWSRETAGLPRAPALEVAGLLPDAPPHRAFPPAPHWR